MAQYIEPGDTVVNMLPLGLEMITCISRDFLIAFWAINCVIAQSNHYSDCTI